MPIYLDNNATTQIAPEVRKAMEPYLDSEFANPSSLYAAGSNVKRRIETARIEIARLIGAKSEREIIFTSGGTESNNSAIRSALKVFPNKRKIITTQVEHSSVKNLCESLTREGYEVVFIGVDKTGALDWDEFLRALTSEVAVVSIMWANNETGVLFPIAEVSRVVKEKGILLHVDAVQAVGKIGIDLAKVHIDYLSFSAHKFHGPKGIGILYVHEAAPFVPFILGGRQERDRRAGTENVPGIIGLQVALAFSLSKNSVQIAQLRDYFEDRLIKTIPDSFINGLERTRIPNTTNITILGIEAEPLLIRLSQAGIYASSGSACLTGALEPSHVLMAMGHSEDQASSSLRFSLSRYNTKEELDSAVEIISNLVHELRAIDPSVK